MAISFYNIQGHGTSLRYVNYDYQFTNKEATIGEHVGKMLVADIGNQLLAVVYMNYDNSSSEGVIQVVNEMKDADTKIWKRCIKFMQNK